MLRTTVLLCALLGVPELVAQPVPLTPGRAIRGSLAKGDTARFQVVVDSNTFVRAKVARMMTPHSLTDGKSTGYRLGLSIDTQGPLKRVHRGGTDRAHRSQLVYYPEIDAGLTVQSNESGFNSGIAFRPAAARPGSQRPGRRCRILEWNLCQRAHPVKRPGQLRAPRPGVDT